MKLNGSAGPQVAREKKGAGYQTVDLFNKDKRRKAREKAWRFVLWFGIEDAILACGYRAVQGWRTMAQGERPSGGL